MADEAQIKPMLETILAEMRAGFAQVGKRFDALEQRFEVVESLVDRAASAAYDTRAEVRELKADVKKLREQLNVPALSSALPGKGVRRCYRCVLTSRHNP